MTNWLKHTLHLSVEEASLIVAVLALIVAIPAAVRPVRSLVVRISRRALLLSGITRRRYERWFLRQNGKLRNIYMNREEVLDLAQTYVSLSFIAPDSGHEERIRATSILAQPHHSRIIITGDPGSGKSTLLNAYATGILRKQIKVDRSDLKEISRSREIPFLIRLRQFADHVDHSRSIARYITEEILQTHARIRGSRSFFERVIKHRRCLVLLDGLDEVPDDRYQSVKDAIMEFSSSDSFTHEARVVVSCRRQNFLRIQKDWIPAFDSTSYTLAPLRDAEIYYFLSKRKREFTAPKTVDAFFANIKTSGTLQLHRTPLILTISLGMYLHLAAYVIPRSIGKFYEQMITELLTRHDFRGDPSGSTNQFNADDKYRFLREFALAMAIRPNKFEDFDFSEATGFAVTAIPKITHVRPEDANSFVREIIDRSGLLTRTSDEDDYIFAHRSIQEYLIAVQLIRDPGNGSDFLLARALQSEWRQVIVFFTALDHQYVETFLSALSDLNLELSGHCLATAVPISDELADGILSRLSRIILKNADVASSMAALVSITGAQRKVVRDQAIALLSDVLGSLLNRSDFISALGNDPESILRLLHALAETDSVQIAAKVPSLLAAISFADEGIVAVMWRCLAAAGMESQPVSAQIVERLLLLTMQKTPLEELQKQPRYVPSFVTQEQRRRVYPFEHGLDERSNLVTLLCWAEKLNVKCSDPNRYLEAEYASAQEFAKVERDWRRRTFALRPYITARVICIAIAAGAFSSAVVSGVGNLELLNPFRNWIISIPLYFAPAILAAVAAGIIANLSIKIYSYHNGKKPEIKVSQKGIETDLQTIYYILNWIGRIAYRGIVLEGRPAGPISVALRNENAILQLAFAHFYKYAPGSPSTAKSPPVAKYQNANPIFQALAGITESVWVYSYFWDIDTLLMIAGCAAVTTPYVIALSPLSAILSTGGWLALSFAVVLLGFWFPSTVACARGSVWYLRKPNPFVDIYEDDRSRHWVTPEDEAPVQ